MATPPFDDAQEAFLRQQKWAVLATGRRDGSPQVSTVGYHYDGRDIAISVKRYTAKWKNAVRQPGVALLVHEGRKQLVVYGRAECLEEDPPRFQLSKRVMLRLQDKEPPEVDETTALEADDAGLLKLLDDQQRTVLRIVPERAFMND